MMKQPPSPPNLYNVHPILEKGLISLEQSYTQTDIYIYMNQPSNRREITYSILNSLLRGNILIYIINRKVLMESGVLTCSNHIEKLRMYFKSNHWENTG